MQFQLSRLASVSFIALGMAASMASAHLVAGSLLPKGGESFAAGSTQTISWTQAVGHNGIYDIYYSKDGGTTWVEFVRSQQFPKTDNTKISYTWTVPTEVTTTGKIRVCQLGQTAQDCGDPTYTLVSTTFNITTAGTSIHQDNKETVSALLKVNLSAQGIEGSYTLMDHQKVTLQALLPNGRLVDALELGEQTAGNHVFVWQPKGLQGLTGSVIFRLKAGEKVLVESMQSIP